MRTCGELALSTLPLSEWGWVCLVPGQDPPTCHPELQKVAKPLSYLFKLTFLKCTYSSHLFQYLMLKCLTSLSRSLMVFLWPELCCRNLALVYVNEPVVTLVLSRSVLLEVEEPVDDVEPGLAVCSSAVITWKQPPAAGKKMCMAVLQYSFIYGANIWVSYDVHISWNSLLTFFNY